MIEEGVEIRVGHTLGEICQRPSSNASRWTAGVFFRRPNNHHPPSHHHHHMVIIWPSSSTTTVSSLSHTSAPGWVAWSGGFRLSRMTAPPDPQHSPPPHHITCDSEFLSTCGNISEKEIQILRISIELILRALKSSGSYSIQLTYNLLHPLLMVIQMKRRMM